MYSIRDHLLKSVHFVIFLSIASSKLTSFFVGLHRLICLLLYSLRPRSVNRYFCLVHYAHQRSTNNVEVIVRPLPFSVCCSLLFSSQYIIDLVI